MKDKAAYEWGMSAPLAPSLKRVRPWGWIWASALAGSASGLVVLVAAWRPLPGLPLPPGELHEHGVYWCKWLVHAVWNRSFARDALFYQTFLAGLPLAERVGMALRCALAACAAIAPAILMAKSLLTPSDGLIFLRGPTRHEGLAARESLAALMRARSQRRPDHDIAPGIAYPSDMWTRHVLVVGGVGSGKSTAIKPLIDKIVKAGEQMFLFDPKSEFTSGFGAPALIAPWDERSLAWDVASDMRNILDMRRFAATMIRESSDPMWSNASRQLLVGLLIYLKGTRGNNWGWLELKEFVALPQSQLLPIMATWHPEAVRAVEKATVTTAGILINLAAFCSSIFDLSDAWGGVPADRRISFVEWTFGRSKFPQVILQGHGAYADLTKSYVEGIVGIVSAIVNSVEMDDDASRKTWFIADEFAQMGKIPVRALFEVGRSRGVRCVVACQDFAQLEELYGAPMVKALIAMCGTILVGQIMPGETSEQLCKAFGAREVERANVSTARGGGAGSGNSTTLSYSREEVALYKPAELASRLGLTPDGKGVILILFTGGQAYELFWPHYNIRRERRAHVSAPWLRGVGAARGRYHFLADERLSMAHIPDSSPQASNLAPGAAMISGQASELGGALAPMRGLDPMETRPGQVAVDGGLSFMDGAQSSDPMAVLLHGELERHLAGAGVGHGARVDYFVNEAGNKDMADAAGGSRAIGGRVASDPSKFVARGLAQVVDINDVAHSGLEDDSARDSAPNPESAKRAGGLAAGTAETASGSDEYDPELLDLDGFEGMDWRCDGSLSGELAPGE